MRVSSRPGTKALQLMIFAAVWGFAEATFFFFIPDILLTYIAFRHGVRKASVATLYAVLGAVFGGMLMYFWGMRDEQSSVRKAAAASFQKLFGIDTGYRYNSTPEKREERIKFVEKTYPQYKSQFEQAGRRKRFEQEQLEKLKKRKQSP